MKRYRLTLPLLLIFGGSLWLCYSMGALDWLKSYELNKYFWPTFAIVFGFIILFNRLGSKNEQKPENLETVEPSEECNVLMSGRSMTFAKGQPFKGMRISCTLGGAKIDLREADIQDRAVISANCLMGGVELYLPNDVNLEIRSNSMIGGIDSERHTNQANPRATIILEGRCLMGGIEIR